MSTPTEPFSLLRMAVLARPRHKSVLQRSGSRILMFSTAEEDFEVQDGQPPKLLNELEAETTRVRMLHAYELVVDLPRDNKSGPGSDGGLTNKSKKPSSGGKNSTSEPDSGSTQPLKKPDGTSTKPTDSKNKRKRSDASSSAEDGDEAQSPTKKPKRSAPDFGNIPEAKIARWLQYCPDKSREILLKEYKKSDGTKEIDEFNVAIPNQARWALERIFTSTFHDLQTEANTEKGLSDDTLKSLVA
jgi:hypothetical protein